METRNPKAMHPTTGELRAFLDDEVSPERSSAIGEHLAACSRCRSVRRRLREDGSVVREAMTKMTGAPDLSRARRELHRRLEAVGPANPTPDARPPEGRNDPKGEADRRKRATGGGRGTRPWSAALRTAAIFVLLVGGITAALPGSPLRAWLLELWSGETDAPTAPGDVAPAPVGSPASPGPGSDEAAAVRVDPREGAIRVELSGVEEGTRVRVRFVDGGRAGVSASGAGAFRTGAGFLGVRDPGDSVSVELPRGVPVAEIRWDDRILLRKSGSSVEFPTLTPEAEDDAFVLTIPSRFQDEG